VGSAPIKRLVGKNDGLADDTVMANPTQIYYLTHFQASSYKVAYALQGYLTF
jgi:hypothetical protein